LSSGGSNSLYAIQSASVVCGLPVAVLLCFFIQSVTLFCEAAVRQGDAVADYTFPTQLEFGMPVYGGVFNTMEYIVSLGRVNTARSEAGMDRATYAQTIEFGKGLLVPFVSLHKTLLASYPQNPKTNTILVVLYSCCYFGWIILCLASISLPGLRGMALTLFFITGFILGTLRRGFRHTHRIRSNAVADYLASLIVWPQVLAQMRLFECKEYAIDEKNNDASGNDEDVA
jgi:hypothetical protein